MMAQIPELPTSESIEDNTIDASTLKQWLECESILLIDVREPIEYANERILGAISNPLSKFNPYLIQSQPKQKIVLYCQSGKRSQAAVRQLKEIGIANATQLKYGLNAWKAESYPLAKSLNAPISLFRQIQIVAGSLVLLGTILGVTISPWGLLLSGFVGAGLLFAGITNTCALGMLLAKLPYNQKTGQRWQ
jgi:rhodanese-related sulfurtransferase